MLVLLNPLFKVAWNSWEVVESWSTNSLLILASDDQWGSLLLSGLRVKIHASAWLHGGGLWLGYLLGELWHSVALNDLNIEIDVGVERNWLTTDWGPGVSTTISIVRWARKMGLVTLVELWNSEIPAVEHLSGTEGEGLWETSWLSMGVSDFSTILEVSSPVNGGPVSWLALWS